MGKRDRPDRPVKCFRCGAIVPPEEGTYHGYSEGRPVVWCDECMGLVAKAVKQGLYTVNPDGTFRQNFPSPY